MPSLPPFGRSRGLAGAGLALGALLLLLAFAGDIAALAPHHYAELVRAGVLLAATVAGTIAIRNGVAVIVRGLDRQAGVLWRNLSTWTLYGLLALWLASDFGLNLSGLLLGGAIVGVVVATASQASLGNFFAGLLLMLGRPYRVGGTLRLRGPALGGVEYEGTVIDAGALHTTLLTANGEILKLPNSAVVTSALVLGEAPLQAEVDLELPPATPLGPIEEGLRRRLDQQVRSITIRPQRLDAAADGKLLCRVQVRSSQPVAPAALAQALSEAVTAVEPTTLAIP
jgi:small-conductance mechanosensitive channel